VGPVAGARLALEREARERHLARERRAQRARHVGHVCVAARAARGPCPHLPRAKARLTAARERRIEDCEVHAQMMMRDRHTVTAMRLAKYLAHAGVASRRAAEGLIAAGRVRVDGVIAAEPA